MTGTAILLLIPTVACLTWGASLLGRARENMRRNQAPGGEAASGRLIQMIGLGFAALAFFAGVSAVWLGVFGL